MSIKLRLLSAGVLAAMAIGALAATSGSAETGGHFTADVEGTFETVESTNHRLEFLTPGSTGIACDISKTTVPLANKTFTAFRFTWAGTRPCTTTVDNPVPFNVHFNGCGLLFKIGKKAVQDNTTEIVCQTGTQIEITHPNCTVRVPAQAGFLGASYENVVEGGKHAITVKLTVGGGTEMTANYEGGICIFLGTTHPIAVVGSFTVKALDAAGKQGNVTATGSAD